VFNDCIASSIERLKDMCDLEKFDIQHDVTTVVMNAVLSELLVFLLSQRKHLILFNSHDIWTERFTEIDTRVCAERR